MPKYLFLISEAEAPYAAPDPDATLFAEVMAMHDEFSAAVTEAGAEILGGEALQPSATATYLRGTRTDAVTAIDNPTPDLKEVFGGYYVIEAADDAQALELAKLCPAPHGYIEIRPVWEFDQG
ncbi:MAG: YciI family protein [Tetrasphaera sp.]